VFAWKGETLEEYWWCTEQLFDFGDGSGPNMILDDGGDATLLVHKGVEFEAAGAVPQADRGRQPRVHDHPRDAAPQPGRGRAAVHQGSRPTSAASPRRPPPAWPGLYKLAKEGTLLFPAINVNDAVTKSKFDNKYGIRHSLVDGLNRATDVMLGGKLAVVCGYGDVGKGSAETLRGQGARVVVTEIDPICALQAAMDGMQVVRLEDVVARPTSSSPPPAATDIITAERHGADEAQRDRRQRRPLRRRDRHGRPGQVPGIEKVEIKPQVHEWRFPDGHSVIVLSEGRLMNLGNATGHPSFVMSNSFTNQVMAQIELWTKPGEYDKQVYVLPKHLDEKVARLHLDALGVRLTELTKKQAEYLGIPVEGPYKPDHYRY
jgi:adenosylhomocysteinase